MRRGQNRKYAGSFISSGNPENVIVGENVSFGGNVFIYDTAKVTIGNNTMIGYGTIIHTSTHDYNNHPIWYERIDQPVEIGEHVWIGAGVIVLSGVKIGNYSVIGAGSVISKNVPEGAVVVGNPARIIKMRNGNKIKKEKMIINKLSDAIIIKKDILDIDVVIKRK